MNVTMQQLVQDTEALVQGATLPTRRSALKAALGVGYVAAAGPLMAQTAIKTSSEGLVSGEITIDVNGFKMPAYRSAPAGKTGLPVVLVISEIFGVHEYIADVTRRLARQGYLAIAPELFVRQGDPSAFGEIARIQSEIIAKVPDAQVMSDLDACVAWAGANGGDTNRMAITGFCWGGRIAWLYAAHQPRLKAAIAWYGITHAGKPVLVRWATLWPDLQEAPRLRVQRLVAGAPIADEADAVALDVYRAAMTPEPSSSTMH